MKLTPSETLTEQEVRSGLRLIVRDGLASEAMLAFTTGAFLVALSVHLGASHFQIGFLAALPTLANVFQLVSIWFVQRFNNRRAICVIFSSCARLPLLVLGILPFIFTGATSIQVVILVLSLHYLFGAISGASWNSWMKDLIPSESMGSFFSHRARMMQIFNVCLSLASALLLDYFRNTHPHYQLHAFSAMYILGGSVGLLGVYILSRTPEPRNIMQGDNVFRMLRKPLMDINFRRLLLFHCCWAFALNMATPFFSVYLMKSLGLSISTVIVLNIISQLSSIMWMKIWGRYIDRFSNKTVIRICAPIYIVCIFSWSFINLHPLMIPMLVVIQFLSGMATGGINVSLINIGLKLAPRNDAIVYIATRNICIALIPALAPLLGGIIADLFTQHDLSWSIRWTNEHGQSIPIFEFSSWSFFFITGSLLALLSLRFLKQVKEQGEVDKDEAVNLLVYSTRRKYSPSRIRKRGVRFLRLMAVKEEQR